MNEINFITETKADDINNQTLNDALCDKPKVLKRTKCNIKKKKRVLIQLIRNGD